ncbi:MAG: nucleotide sugar dehydrogenase [Planctomycetota bacterium]
MNSPLLSEARHEEAFLRRLERRDLTVGIIGLGWVGLPLACAFAGAGFRVVGLDVDGAKVERLRGGGASAAEEEARGWVERGRLDPTTAQEALRACEAMVICVPTPLSKFRDPDISHILAARQALLPQLRAGDLVVLESTSWPGTTEELLARCFTESGYRVGEDLFVAFSPERVDPGNPHYGIRNTPKVVGGVTAACTRVAGALYATVVDRVVPVRSARTAEMVKLLENSFRAVNIALVNEMALICDRLGIGTYEVVEAAATKPFGFMPFWPGPGIGGGCIPVNPVYLTWRMKTLGFAPRLIETAGEINAAMPAHVVDRLGRLLGEDGRALSRAVILLVGVTYKRDVPDTRESPARDIARLLLDRGVTLRVHDPLARELDLGEQVFVSEPLTVELLRGIDGAVLVADHRTLDYGLLLQHAPRILDARGVLRGKAGRAKVVSL